MSRVAQKAERVALAEGVRGVAVARAKAELVRTC